MIKSETSANGWGVIKSETSANGWGVIRSETSTNGRGVIISKPSNTAFTEGFKFYTEAENNLLNF